MKHASPHNQPDHKNLLIAMVMSALLIMAWQFFVEIPKRQQLAKANVEAAQQKQERLAREQIEAQKPEEEAAKNMTRDERLEQGRRLAVNTTGLRGSIALTGLRFDDMVLTRHDAHLDLDAEKMGEHSNRTYHEALPASEDNKIILLTPQGEAHPYFIQLGWLSADGKTVTPSDKSQWKTDAKALNPQSPVTLSWDNGQGVTFYADISVDDSYMFTIRQRVENRSGAEIKVSPYSFINRGYTEPKFHVWIMHEGPLGVQNGVLQEIQYSQLRDDGAQKFDASSNGWVGMTDKYWLTALIPDKDSEFKAEYDYYQSKGADRYQAETVAAAQTIAPGGNAEYRQRLFAGAKEINILDRYTEGTHANREANVAPIPLFDRAVDFGALYFLTKPLFLLLNFFYTHIMNFGLAIMLLTVVVKAVMFPLANKAYKTSTQLRELQPELLKLRDLHGDDRMKMQQEMMRLYKKSKVNPAAGCLPFIIQIPVFFALYKVLYVTIEMRHAPFFGWLRDLSAADPSNIFTLFGLIAWNPPAMMHIGILPLLMSITMYIQMQQQPQPTDKTQALMMKWMPWVFLLFFAGMPAGLILYWTWSNILSIVQQWVISRKYGHHAPKADKAVAKAEAK